MRWFGPRNVGILTGFDRAASLFLLHSGYAGSSGAASVRNKGFLMSGQQGTDHEKTMSATIANPKDDLISQATERRTIFARLALRERSQQHPVVMFAAIVTAAFAWTLVPGEPNVSMAS